MHVGTDFLKLPPVTGQYWSLFQCSVLGTGGTCAAGGHLTFTSFGQAKAITRGKSLASLWFVATNISKLEHDCHGDFVHTFHLVPMPKL